MSKVIVTISVCWPPLRGPAPRRVEKETSRFSKDAWVLIEDRRQSPVEPARPAADKIIRRPRAIWYPGLVDAHTT